MAKTILLGEGFTVGGRHWVNRAAVVHGDPGIPTWSGRRPWPGQGAHTVGVGEATLT